MSFVVLKVLLKASNQLMKNCLMFDKIINVTQNRSSVTLSFLV